MRVVFVTEGDPGRMSGGSLYHRRLVGLAPRCQAEVRFVSVPPRPFPIAAIDGPAVMRSATDGSDVVVVDSLASNTLGPAIARRAGRHVALVGSIHQTLGGMDVGRVRRAVQTKFDAMAWAGCAHLVVASELLASQVAAQGVPTDDMTVVPPGRDVYHDDDGSLPTTALDLRRGRRAAILCVANWLPRKGVVQLLDALAALPASSATLHLVGDETVDPAYRRRVMERLGRVDLTGRVVRHGIVAPEAMGAMYEAADVFSLPSTQEPYGIVYAEAMSAGIPVVGWSSGNLPNLVDDGVEGRVVPTGDIPRLSRALLELCEDRDRRAQMGEAAGVRADKLPTWTETAEQFFAVCRHAAERGGRARPR